MDEQQTDPLPYPLARREDLVIEELADETLVYDLRTHRAHCLNAAASLVWRHCDGHTDTEGLAALLHERLDIPPEPRIVELALQQLKASKLLAVAPDGPKVSRRELVSSLKLVLGASVVLPAVLSIVAPEAASAASNRCLGLSNAKCQGTVACRGGTGKCRRVNFGSGKVCVCV